MKKTFIAGLIILLPIAITIFLLIFFVDLLTDPFVHIVKGFVEDKAPLKLERNQGFIILISRIIVLVLLFFAILLLGFLGRRVFFNYLIKLTEKIFGKLPVIRRIYKVSVDVTKQMFADSSKLFQKPTIIPFPHNRSIAFGFETGSAPQEVLKKKEADLRSVFVPTSPHPISGFLIMMPHEDIREIDIRAEDIFKILVSAGVYQPATKEPIVPHDSKTP